MTGRDVSAIHQSGAGQELVELDVSVAVDTGVRSPAAFICVDEPPDDLFLEIVAEIEDEIGHSEPVRDASGVLDIRE